MDHLQEVLVLEVFRGVPQHDLGPALLAKPLVEGLEAGAVTAGGPHVHLLSGEVFYRPNVWR
jgi:hypothetical protein